ncbi:dnaJ homolog subfamily C member 15 [Rhizophagus irregularis DAOM 181602=DAOM 197198]|uniref:J domain-containing protein n=1 Tax=Rhizophagus irregularis (strain DAOM 181602 / DAOM 197198 / MUCL 43194) TaxID=747089 RepID=U9TX89_RHIID|nr:hypothetical protein GLOIN_2v1822844 [Rhizophagus irregularis DAOM 181602=DAOM 197198]POG58017.1 hypothetical protein GLOIN_2v1822844 [Rhizophagus irregularis DAOM 181602=DAOM 197198]GBC49382.1 dnaJ homolog subfamily C member 15 [Rhizophagus irregularis DAOM 181602=DAOM 197198]|eukprot:XP_025164883.1 hypothetical protein GLOIN_2v1822844 [Rhizophagus irregularis DAOM 181602=DAOM 197198]
MRVDCYLFINIFFLLIKKNFINKERDINRAKIKEAYRKTLMLNHPDKGGSPYLASKIIEAKNFLEKVIRK